jgi:hypothetical protein
MAIFIFEYAAGKSKSIKKRKTKFVKNKLVVISSVFALMLGLALSCVAQANCKEDGSIRSVTKARMGNFETVTFDVNSATPDYEVKTEKPPFQQYGSEKTLRIKGPYYKSVYFKSVAWTCNIVEKVKASTSNIAAVKNIEQFEGYIDYIIGYKKKGSYISTTKSTVGKRTKIVVKFKR